MVEGTRTYWIHNNPANQQSLVLDVVFKVQISPQTITGARDSVVETTAVFIMLGVQDFRPRLQPHNFVIQGN